MKEETEVYYHISTNGPGIRTDEAGSKRTKVKRAFTPRFEIIQDLSSINPMLNLRGNVQIHQVRQVKSLFSGGCRSSSSHKNSNQYSSLNQDSSDQTEPTDQTEKKEKSSKNSSTKCVLPQKQLGFSDFLAYNPQEIVSQIIEKERISDFYEYTRECLKKIPELEEKPPVERGVKIQNTERKKIAIFDLDETLVHCIGKVNPNDKSQSYQHEVEVTLPLGKKVMIGINVRPHLKKALDLIKDEYYLVLYTASHESYTTAVMKLIDPDKKYFKDRLCRSSCIPTKIDGRDFFIKDLEVIQGFSLKDMIIIDNSVLSFAYQLSNGIPIVPYYEGEEDNELLVLAYYLLNIKEYEDLREANEKFINISMFLENFEQDKGRERHLKS